MAQGFEPMCINQLHRDLMLLFIALTFETFFFCFCFCFCFCLVGDHFQTIFFCFMPDSCRNVEVTRQSFAT